MSEQPKKPQKKSKPKRINVSAREKWVKILKDIEKDEVPVSCLEALQVNLKDGTTVTISIIDLLREGYTTDEIEDQINDKLHKLDFAIQDVDFFVDIEQVAKTIQPITDNFLKNLQ